MVGAGSITTYDIVVFSIFALLIGRGIWLGFLRQVTVFVALYVGYLAASQYHDKFFPFLRELSESPEVIFLGAYALMFITTFLVVTLVGKLLAHAVQISLVGWFDRFLGGVLGIGKAIIIVVLVHMALGVILPPESKIIRTCQSCGQLDQAVQFTRKIIKDEDVRHALEQRQPAISLETVKDVLTPASSGIFGEDAKKSSGKDADRQQDGKK